MQLGPNKTFKSKLWTFENTVQTVSISIDQEITGTKIEEISSKPEPRKPFKFTPSNFVLFQKEFFQDFVDYKIPQVSKPSRSARDNEDNDEKGQEEEDDDDEEENDSEYEDDDKIEDGIINYDEITEDPEILSNIVNTKNENKTYLQQQQQQYNQQPISYEMPPMLYEPIQYENDVSNYNKKLRLANTNNNNENTCNLTYNESIQYIHPQDQSYYINTNSLQCLDSVTNRKYPHSYDDQEFFKSNQENFENHFPKSYQTYDFNNNAISCNYSANNNSNNRSPYYLTSLQNTSYVLENQFSNTKYTNELNDYSSIFDLTSAQSSALPDPSRYNSKPTGQSFSHFSSSYSNPNDFNSSMSSSTSSLCSYYNMNTLHENSIVNNQQNLNDFNMSQNYY